MITATKLLIAMGAFSTLIACTPVQNASEKQVITLQKAGGKAPLRYEQTSIRVAFVSKGVFRVFSGTACQVEGRRDTVKFTAPQKFNVPVYAGLPSHYDVTCQMELGASIRTFKGKIEPEDPKIIATDDTEQTYKSVNYVLISN